MKIDDLPGARAGTRVLFGMIWRSQPGHQEVSRESIWDKSEEGEGG
jgi:hypothetical protein